MSELHLLEHMHIFAPDTFFSECHASTIEQLPDGSLCAAWFGGTKEKADDVAIYTACQQNGVWSNPSVAADFPNIPCWNPVLFYNGKSLLLFFKAGKEITNWETFVVESADGGVFWSAPFPLVQNGIGGRGPVKNKPIRLLDGRICAPASLETSSQWSCFVDLSADNGKSWKKSSPVPMEQGCLTGLGMIQPSLWQNRNGEIYMLMRSTEGCLFRSHSSDGDTWSTAERTGIPNNNSGIDLDMLPDGRLVMVYNPIAGNWAGRNSLVLGISEDGGQSFHTEAVLENEPSKEHREAEFSYPAVICRGHDLYVTYTYKRKTISYWHFSISKA